MATQEPAQQTQTLHDEAPPGSDNYDQLVERYRQERRELAAFRKDPHALASDSADAPSAVVRLDDLVEARYGAPTPDNAGNQKERAATAALTSSSAFTRLFGRLFDAEAKLGRAGDRFRQRADARLARVTEKAARTREQDDMRLRFGVKPISRYRSYKEGKDAWLASGATKHRVEQMRKEHADRD